MAERAELDRPSSAERPPRLGRLAPAVLALAVGAVIVTLAVPRTVAALWRQFQLPVLAELYAGRPVAPDALEALIAAHELALEWHDAPEHHMVLVVALLRQMTGAADEPAAVLLERAVDAAEHSLARAPGDPRGWLRLAYLRTLQEGPGARAAAALALSARTGAHDLPEIAQLRLRLMLLNQAFLDAEGRAALARQARLLWRVAPARLLALAEDSAARAVIARALGDDPEALSAFRARIRESATGR